MRAVTVAGKDMLPVLENKDLPVAGLDEVVLQLYASAMNHRDVWITKGLYPGIRYGCTMGSDGCGTYLGQEYIINPGLGWGDSEQAQSSSFRVLGVPDEGTFADNIAIDRKYLHPKPDHLSVHQAAALPLAGVTAYRALLSRARATAGEKVLITGIGGGVALMAMQFALAQGCAVFVTSSDPDKIHKAKSMGASEGYNYKDPDWPKKLAADAGGVDVVIDGACGAGFSSLVKVCNPGGRIAFYGATAGPVDSLNPQAVFWKQLSILGSTMGSESDFALMVDFVAKHRVTPVIDEVIPLDNFESGFRRMAAGSQFGKIVFSH